MFDSLLKSVRAVTLFTTQQLITAFFFLFFIPVIPLKAIIPHPAWRRFWTRPLLYLAGQWAAALLWLYRAGGTTTWHISGLEGIRRDQSYLLIVNHLSGIDILAVLAAVNRRTPTWRYFMKSSLRWVPFLGQACWAMDFPFMRRHSKKWLARHPERRHDDLHSARRACEKFLHSPATIIVMPEGTRRTAARQAASGSPWPHLLRPKAGGAALVLEAMGDQIDTILDLTITYPDKVGIWSFLRGEQPDIFIDVAQVPVPEGFRGRSYLDDELFRTAFQAWLNERWALKDGLIAQRIAAYQARQEGV